MNYNSYNERRSSLLDKEKAMRDQLYDIRKEIVDNSRAFALELNEEYKDYIGKLVTVKGRERWTRMSLSERKGYFEGFVASTEIFLTPTAILYKPKKDGSKSKVLFAEADRIHFDEVFTITVEQ